MNLGMSGPMTAQMGGVMGGAMGASHLSPMEQNQYNMGGSSQKVQNSFDKAGAMLKGMPNIPGSMN